jgi:hypothetical protein
MSWRNRIVPTLTAALVFFLPAVLSLPFFTDPFDFPRSVVVITVALLGIGLWSILLLSREQLVLTKTPLTVPLFLYIAAYLPSIIFAANKVEALLLPLGLGSVLAMFLLFLFITGPLHRLITTSSGLMALALAAAVVPLSFLLPFLPASLLPELVFTSLAICLPLTITLLVFAVISFRQQHLAARSVMPVVVGLVPLVTLGLLLATTLNRHIPLASLPYLAGWQIAADALKSQPLWGYGPTNFTTAFTISRPAWLNFDKTYWNYRFFVSSDLPLQLMTTLGLPGLFAYCFLIASLLRLVVRRFTALTPLAQSLSFGLVAVIILQLLLPPTFTALWFFFGLLALLSLELRSLTGAVVDTRLSFSAASPKFSTIHDFLSPTPMETGNDSVKKAVGGGLLVITLVIGYFLGRGISAEYTYKRALDEVTANQATRGYASLIAAIGLNPYREAFHLTYSQVNFSLANALAQKKDLTDSDRQTINQLVQQAIREAKAAVALNPSSAPAWENLAGLYRSLIQYAQGADQWAITALRQTVILDPTNPTQRLALGTMYQQLGQYDDALLMYRQAATLKPDWADAHYSTAEVLKQKNDLAGAASELQSTLSLLPLGSDQSYKVSQELEQASRVLGTQSAQLQPTATPPPTPQPPLLTPAPSGPPTVSPTPYIRLLSPIPRSSPSPSIKP